MDPKPKVSAKDFFLHLGVIVTLYTVMVTLLMLVFRVVDKAFPIATSYATYYSPSISGPVATLIVFFPIFLLLSWLLSRDFTAFPEKRLLGVRKWLTALTLFITGLAIAGDLVTVLYYFLDGRELTANFLAKVVTVLVVAALVFIYYISDLRDKINSKSRYAYAIAAAVLILAAIVWGFSVIGSPYTQRKIHADEQRISSLQNIQNQIVYYWQRKQILPKELADLNNSISSFSVPMDPETKQPYGYEVTGPTSFKLCATFGADSTQSQASYYNVYGTDNDNWKHGKGNVCFDRTIDPALYPPIPAAKNL